MFKQGYMDYVFEIEIDWNDLEEVAEDVFVLREDLYFSEYEVLGHGAFENYEDYSDDEMDRDDYYDEDDESDSMSQSSNSDSDESDSCFMDY